MLLRGLVIVIVLFNLGYFAWTQHWLGFIGLEPIYVGEPERLQQQIHPEKLLVEADNGYMPAAQPVSILASMASASASVRTDVVSELPAK